MSQHLKANHSKGNPFLFIYVYDMRHNQRNPSYECDEVSGDAHVDSHDVLYTEHPKYYMYRIRKLRQIINEKNVIIEALNKEVRYLRKMCKK